MEFLFAAASLLSVTVVASFIYYQRIKEAQGEYEGAKDLVKSITLSFTDQINRLIRYIDGIKEEAIKSQISVRDALEIARESLEKTSGLSERVDETGRTVEFLKTEIHRLSTARRASVHQKDVDAPIPLQQDDVLEQLTQTEVEVLAIIEELEEGSVPEIRDRINKTREHTARLLKKLFERGFIDRNTSAMPYRYYIRKEIKELIQKHKKRIEISV